MAELTVTKTIELQPGDVLNVRSGFGLDLEDGAYVLSCDGPGAVYLALANDAASLPTRGHPVFVTSPPFPIELIPGQGGEPFVWLRGPYPATVVISPAP